MNNRGVFITFMVFLLIASVLALHSANKSIDFAQERKEVKGAAFNVVNNTFNNLYEEVVSLNKEGYAKDVQQRPMPFAYDFDKNSIILSQRLPVRKPILDAYIDALNIYSIFVNSEEGKSDLNIITETVQDGLWGGSIDYPDLNYVILPQCLLFDVNACCIDANYMILQELQDGENGCVGGFDYTDLKVVDINISIDSTSCTTGGISGNMATDTEPYSPTTETDPYLIITINETNLDCPGASCLVTANGKESRSRHFDPEDFGSAATTDSLKITCDSADWLRIKAGREGASDTFPVVIKNSRYDLAANIDLNLTFDRKVEQFYFTGFSVNVEKKNFPIKRST